MTRIKGRFVCINHQNKANAYINALKQAGYRRTAQLRNANFLLADHDVGKDGVGFKKLVLDAHELGIPIFMYPHAARPMIQWDGMYPVFEHTRCNFVHSEGHAEVMRRYGYPIRTHVVGWGYCPIKPFKSRNKVETVLFAPIHPNYSGWLCKEDLEVNKQAFKILLDLPVKVTVRHIGDIKKNGLWREPNVDYHLAKPNNSYLEAEKHDFVVSFQTFLYLCVARGIPVVSYGEDVRPHSGNYEWNLRWVESWNKYKEFMRFPMDLLNTDDPMLMLENAANNDEMVADWRERFIGKPFDPEQFVSTLESYL